MGKVRRERHKYHIAGSTKKPDTDTSPVKDVESSPQTLEISVPDNPFAGIDISYETLNQLKDSDARSVISFKSTSTSNVPIISKKEKRKLRHEAFLKKLEAAYHTRKEKGRKVLKLAKDPKPLSDKLPVLDLNLGTTDKKDKTRKVKHRSIPKAKKRKKNMMQDIALFKNLLDEFGKVENFEEIVSSQVQEKVLNEAFS